MLTLTLLLAFNIRRGGWNRWRHPRGFGPLEMAPPTVGDHFQVGAGQGRAGLVEWIHTDCTSGCCLGWLACTGNHAGAHRARLLSGCPCAFSPAPAQATISVPKDAYSMDFVFT